MSAEQIKVLDDDLIARLKKATTAVYLATEASVARDLSTMIGQAVFRIERLRQELEEAEWCAVMSRGDNMPDDDDLSTYDAIYSRCEDRCAKRNASEITDD